MYKFVIDMMGGDNGVTPFIEAINEYISKHDNVTFYCVGDVNLMNNLKENELIKLVDAKNVIKMDENIMSSLKDKESSMIKALSLYKEIKADAIISSGGTGPYLGASTIMLGRIKGISRPCLVAPFPTKVKGRYVTVLDIGANSECSVDQLHQFAIMGKEYANAIFDISCPRISLLSNGSEAHKGNTLTKETYNVLSEDKSLNFIGNIEARDALEGTTDVIVADGFSGNILLKSIEGVFSIVNSMLKKGFKSNPITMIGYLFSHSVVGNLRKTFDYKAVGGAMLLGVNAVVVKAHGNADKKTVLGAINVAYNMVNNHFLDAIKENLNKEESKDE